MAARADGDRLILIFDVKPIKRRRQRRALRVPIETAIIRAQNCAVGADRPAVRLIHGEANGMDRIALRQRILPEPASSLCMDF
jgi:hypothetical protein